MVADRPKREEFVSQEEREDCKETACREKLKKNIGFPNYTNTILFKLPHRT